jgi:hypothetical protein
VGKGWLAAETAASGTDGVSSQRKARLLSSGILAGAVVELPSAGACPVPVEDIIRQHGNYAATRQIFLF